MDKEKLLKAAFVCIKRDLEKPSSNCFGFASVTGVVSFLRVARLIKDDTFTKIFDLLDELPIKFDEYNFDAYINASNDILRLIAEEGGFQV